jgi:hypothetical protein
VALLTRPAVLLIATISLTARAINVAIYLYHHMGFCDGAAMQ